MKAKIKIFSSGKGYDLAAANYDKKEKYLNSFEKGRLLPLICHCEERSDAAIPSSTVIPAQAGIRSLCLRNQRILDAGAGTGRLAVELARQGAEVTALDVSSEMLKVLKKKNKNIKTVVGDVESLPFENNSFGLVVSAFVTVHLKNPKRFFDEVYRVLKDGGKFLVTNINQKEPPEVETKTGKIKIESFYHRPEEVREILGSLAFNIEKEVFVKEGENWVNQILVARK